MQYHLFAAWSFHLWFHLQPSSSIRKVKDRIKMADEEDTDDKEGPPSGDSDPTGSKANPASDKDKPEMTVDSPFQNLFEGNPQANSSDTELRQWLDKLTQLLVAIRDILYEQTKSQKELNQRLGKIEKSQEELNQKADEKFDKITDSLEKLEGQVIPDKPLKKLKSNALDPSNSVDFVENHWNDPEAISQHLYGVPLDEARKCFENLHDKTPFEAEDQLMIISLLIRINLFLREKYIYTNTYRKKRGNSCKALKAFNYKLDIKEGKYDPDLVNKMLQNKTDLDAALKHIVDAHLFEPYRGTNEATADDAFRGIYGPITKLINLFESTNIEYSLNPTINTAFGTIIPDGMDKEDDDPFFPFECKVPPLAPENRVKAPNKLVHNWKTLDSPLRQPGGYMLLGGYFRAVLHDGKRFYFMEIDYDAAMKLKAEDPNDPTLPITVQFCDIYSVNPSIVECLIGWTLVAKKHKADRTPDEIKALQELYLKKNSNDSNDSNDSKKRKHPDDNSQGDSSSKRPKGPGPSTGNPKSLEVGGNQTRGNRSGVSGRLRSSKSLHDLLENSEGSTSPTSESSDEEKPQTLIITKGFKEISTSDHPVFKVEASELSSFVRLQSQEHFAVKIFDPKAAYEQNPFKVPTGSDQQVIINRQLPMLNWLYANETGRIWDLNGDPEFNNCYLNHNQLSATVETANGSVSGKCLISRFIETVPLPKNNETRDKVVQQLKVLHKHKIIHNDISEKNILYTKEGDIYLIDLELAIVDPEDEEEYQKDYKALNQIFT